MEISAALKLKQQLEADILAMLRRYNDATGIMPTGLTLDIATVTRIGYADTQTLSGVRVRIEL